ncbi:restriction endonuclease subunit S [Streptococcus constellatus]|uniref:restriction endonuclease subunit S n=1 Tax=Streptococcus constellatus TaxID=76860 RepID=UPI0003919E7D|nr:restriction endonuclease subunit S [Streptococcus constellatus]GAD37768.1 hypothetical protein ANG2_0096 [Streptococcus constellatus subsp. constellatus SK53]
MDEWKKVKLGDICQTNLETYSLSEKWDFVNYLDTGSLTKNVVSEYQEIDLQNDKLPSRARRKISVNDILYSTVRPNQEHYGIVKEVVPNMLVSTGFTVISVNQELADSDFIYYCLTQREVIEHLQAIGEQSTSAYPSIKPTDIENLELFLPSLNEQREIVSVLRVLDDKIENNRKINHHLEEIALSIFNKHFGKAETTNKLGDFFPVITGKKDANVAKGGKYPFFSCSQNISYTDNYSFDNKAILLAGNGDFNVKIYDGKFEAYQRTYVLIPNNDEQFGYLYYAIKYFLNDITSGYRGSVIKFITKGSIENFNIFMTDDKKVLSLFNIFVEKIANNNKETQELANLRDTLLPKLLSGEISVNQATK